MKPANNPTNQLEAIFKNKYSRIPVLITTVDFVGPKQYSINYTGLLCEKETTWDRGTNSDEIFVVASVVPAYQPETSQTIKNPIDRSYYPDVDSGEFRLGPIANIWRGPAQEITLHCIVYEQDDGDPNKYRDKIKVAVDTIALAAKGYFGWAPPDVVKDFMTNIINDAFGSEDDLIQEQYMTISKQQLITYGSTPSTEYIKSDTHTNTKIPHNFYTTHKGGGATYCPFFEVNEVG